MIRAKLTWNFNLNFSYLMKNLDQKLEYFKKNEVIMFFALVQKCENEVSESSNNVVVH
jgi:hypothetical protein